MSLQAHIGHLTVARQQDMMALQDWMYDFYLCFGGGIVKKEHAEAAMNDYYAVASHLALRHPLVMFPSHPHCAWDRLDDSNFTVMVQTMMESACIAAGSMLGFPAFAHSEFHSSMSGLVKKLSVSPRNVVKVEAVSVVVGRELL